MTFTAVDILLQSVHVFAACIALAFVEIQVEGEHGWAKNLPTWRGQPRWAAEGSLLFALLRRVYGALAGGNELTGYHLSLMSFLLLIVLFPVSFAQDRFATLLVCLGWLSLMCVVWDFLWFVFNRPAYGIGRFKPQFIAWHPRWLGPVPAPYYGGVAFGALLIALGTGVWTHAVIALLVLGVGTLCCVALAQS